MKNLFLFYIFGASIFVCCHTLKCYICNSHLDEACQDSFRGNHSSALQMAFYKDCPDLDGIKPFCRKARMNVFNQPRIHRDCGYERKKGYDCFQKRSEDYILDVCQCDEDGCNSAPGLSQMSIASTILVLLVLPLRHL